MVVRLAHPSGRVRNLTDCNLPIVHGEVGKILLKNRTERRLAFLILGVGGGLSEQSESCSKSISTSCHHDI